MKKLITLLFLFTSSFVLYANSGYDSTLIEFRNRGDANCQTYDFSERKFLILNDNDSIILIQDSIYFSSVSFENSSRSIFKLNVDHEVVESIFQIWADTIWLNSYKNENLGNGEYITYQWSIVDSAWIYNERLFKNTSNDTLFIFVQKWNIASTSWYDYLVDYIYSDSIIGLISSSYLQYDSLGNIIWGSKQDVYSDSVLGSVCTINSVYNTITSVFDYTTRDSTVTGNNGYLKYREAQNWVSNQWINLNKEEHTLGLNNLDEINSFYSGNGVNWDNQSKSERFYTASGLLESTNQYLGSGILWNNSERSEYLYRSDNLDSLKLDYIGNGSTWRLSYSHFYSYNINNLLTQELIQFVDSLNNYSNFERFNISYTPTNKFMLNLKEVWSGSAWENSILDSAWYDIADSLTGQLTSQWNGSNWDLILEIYTTYISHFPLSYQYSFISFLFPADNESYRLSYDIFGRLIERYEVTGAGMSSQTRRYEYYADNSYSYTFSAGCSLGGLGIIQEIYFYKPFKIQMIDTLPLCFGDTITTTVVVENGKAPFIYLWEPNYNISDNAILNTSFYPTSDTTYQLTVVDSSGNVSRHFINLVVNTPIQPSIGPDTLICLNATYNINIDNSFTNLMWQDGASSNPYVVNTSIPSTLQMILLADDSNNCQTSDTALIIVSACSSIDVVEETNMPIIYPTVLSIGESLKIRGELPESASIEFFNLQGWRIEIQLNSNNIVPQFEMPSGCIFYSIKSYEQMVSRGKIIFVKK